MSSADISRLIDLMYRCVDDPAQVNEFLVAICKAMRCHSGSVHIHDLAHGQGRIPALIGYSGPAELIATYESRYAADNVFMQRAAPLMAEGKVLYSADLISFDEFRNTRYWREFTRELDVDYAVGLIGLLDNDTVVAGSLNYSDKRGPFDAQDRALLELLMPHWVNVCRLQRKFGLLNLEVGSLRATLDRIETAVLFLDASGQVCGSNLAAEQILASGQLFHVRHARLFACWHADTGPLQQAIDASVGASLRGAVAAHSLVLRDAHGEPQAVANLRSLPPGTAGAHPQACVALFVRGTHAPRGMLAPLLEAAYALTPAEAHLAAAFVDSGDADTAAISCGITPATARSRFKQIFAKTGAHGQAQLMLLLGRWSAASSVLP